MPISCSKICVSGINLWKYKKTVKPRKFPFKISNKTCFINFCHILIFWRLVRTFIDLKCTFLVVPTNFAYRVTIFTQIDVGIVLQKNFVSKLVIQPTHGHFMAFMALKNQTIGFPNKSTPNEPSKLKKLPNFENFKFWPLFWPSKFFWPFAIFC